MNELENKNKELLKLCKKQEKEIKELTLKLARAEEYTKISAPSYEQLKKAYEILKSHIVEIDNNPDNGDDYYFIAFEKTKEVRELLEGIRK